MSNATDTEERVRAGFAALLEDLRAGLVDNPVDAKKVNAAALEREQARVRAEYAEQGLTPPSPLALSITALRTMAQVHAERRGQLPIDQQDAAE